ncbi:DUF262 domain-containing protein [Novilysobacter erysipheiresistens]|uniref:DUF262 domain-containing protein n=1 Tax=Novilysobacter erysipheiresistens TaxID=1749332 RepID=A0ABU7Z011_9GAMM
MQKRDPKPEIQRLEELAMSVKAGDVKLPKFQRPFVWKRGDILKLLDSIYKGYPIGSLLMWNSSQRLTSERSIDGLELNSAEQISYPTNYLLDGQQRLTALCGALFWEGRDLGSQWNIHFDLEKEEFVYPKEPGLIHLFPLNRLINTSEFIRQCMKFEHHERGPIYMRNAERLLRAIKDYKIAVVKIGDMTVEEVAPIFERINSTGRKLTIVDLMVAATWSNGFDLNDVIQEIASVAEAANFGEVKDRIILRSISAATGGGINKEDIQRLRKYDAPQLLSASSDARRGVAHTIDFLNNRLGLRDFSRVPYAFQFTHLVEYFRLAGRADRQREDELVRWIWFTSVTRYFASANTGDISRDLDAIRAFANGASDRMYERGTIDITRFLFDKFNLRISTSISFTLLLSNMRPQLSVDGRAINDAYLDVKDSRLYAAVDPQLKSNIGQIIHPFADRPSAENFVHLGDHFIDERSRQHLVRGEIETFCDSRAQLIVAAIEDFTQCEARFTPLGRIEEQGDIFESIDDIEE